MLGAVGCDVAVNEPVHMCNAMHAGKMAQITAEALAVPVIAEKSCSSAARTTEVVSLSDRRIRRAI